MLASDGRQGHFISRGRHYLEQMKSNIAADIRVDTTDVSVKATTTEERQHPDSNRPWPVVYYDLYDGEMLWGATARMTLSLIDVLQGES